MDAALTTFLASFTTNAGASYSLVAGITSSSVTRLSQSVNNVLALTRPLQVADFAFFQGVLSSVLETSFSSLGISQSVTVELLDQITFVTSVSQSSVMYDCILGINVGGALFDSRAFRKCEIYLLF